MILSWRTKLPALVIVFTVMTACGGTTDQDATDPPGSQSSDQPSPFSDMRPGPEDLMALPRLGFVWEFDASEASVQGADVEEIRFVVHVAHPSGELHDTLGTWHSEAVMNLHPDFQPGACSWWVEAILPDGSVIQSPRSRFTIVE